MKTTFFAIALLVATTLLAGDKPAIKQVDANTWMWQKDTTLVVMKVVYTSTDTVANYHYYAHTKTTRVRHFNVKRFLDSQK